MKTVQQKNSHLPGLDGIRAIAIAMVLFVHYYTIPIYVVPGGFIVPGSFWAYVGKATSLFWTGVDLFFVLSGFLITRILLTNLRSPNLLKTFYTRRSLRIFPTYFLFLLVFWIYATLWPHGQIGDANDSHVWPYIIFVQNIYWWLSNVQPAIPLGPTWSLAVEEQFYLCLPFLMLLVGRSRIRFVFIGALIISVVLRLLVSDYSNAATPFRLDGLALGGLLAHHTFHFGFPKFSYAKLVAVLAMLAGIFTWFTLTGSSNPLFTIIYPTVGAIGLVLILLAVTHSDKAIGRILDSGPLTWLGRRSYFIYIWHLFVKYLLYIWFGKSSLVLISFEDLFLTISALIITLILAESSWRLIERPLIMFGQRRNYRGTESR